jgi:uncharacterized protein YndB with AHSA1/START domain
MGHIEHSGTIPAPVEAVWATIVDLSTWNQWFTVLERWMTEPPEILTEGTQLSAKIVMLGMANKIEMTFDEVEAPRRLVMGGTGMAGVKCSFTMTLEPAGADAALFTVAGDFEGALVKGALAKAVEKDGLKQLEKAVTGLGSLAGAHA